MKSKFAIFIAILLIFQLTASCFAYAKVAEEEDDPVKTSLDAANAFLNSIGYTGGLFLKASVGGRYSIIDGLAVKGNDAFWGKPVFAYGSAASGAKEATKYGNDSREMDSDGEYRAIGFSFFNEPYPNPKFDIDKVNYVRRWIKNPWELPDEETKQIRQELSPDDPSDTHTYQYMNFEPNKEASTYSVIHQWIKNNKAFLPNKVGRATGQNDYFSSRVLESLPSGIAQNPEDYIYVIQPPTYDSWGVGIAFYYYGGNGADSINNPNDYSYYQYFRLMPFSIADLSARFKSVTSSAAVGEEVLVTVNVDSNFEEDLKGVPFKWSITSNGQPLDNITFGGDAIEGAETIDIPKNKKGATLYASFIMPETNVDIKFEINKDGNNPPEKIIENNIIDFGTSIKAKPSNSDTVEKYSLDYNVLSRKVQFALSKSSITAGLSLPKGHWDGNATGSLGVNNLASTLLRNFTVKNNPAVNEASSTIVRNPNIQTTLKRSDFGDDPPNRIYLSGPTSKSRSGSISYSGTVSRPYEYTEYYTWTDLEGIEHEESYDVSDSTSAAFNSGENKVDVKAMVYNGKAVITPKTFKNTIDDNTTNSFQKNLFWTSEPYKINVVRWMCHQDLDDSFYDWTTVPGQYQRTFTQQDTADIKWSVASSLAQDYSRSREAAKRRHYSKSESDRAVFASDIDYKYVAYPIKSGYYFNPTGEYSFNVVTVTYKPTTADTQEHKDIVRSVINSFRYESDLMYINSSRVPVNIQNERLSRYGNSYARKSASLTAQNPTGVDGITLLEVLDRNDSPSRYSKAVDEIEHSEDSDGYTHTYWKNILEGYNESGTISSKDKYKYREYIKDGHHIYKITETTRVTIRINHANRKVYTYANMPNGNYNVKAWVGNINLNDSGNEYGKLGALKGLTKLDGIVVSVKGSMYDDIY